MIKQLIGYILAAAIVALLVYTILGRNEYSSLWPRTDNSESAMENRNSHTDSSQVESSVQPEEDTPAGKTTSEVQDSLKTPDSSAPDTLLSEGISPAAID